MVFLKAIYFQMGGYTGSEPGGWSDRVYTAPALRSQHLPAEARGRAARGAPAGARARRQPGGRAQAAGRHVQRPHALGVRRAVRGLRRQHRRNQY